MTARTLHPLSHLAFSVSMSCGWFIGRKYRVYPSRSICFVARVTRSHHARDLWETHRPDQFAVTMWWAFGFLPYLVWPTRQCKLCQTRWMRREAAWANRWFSALERGWSHLVEVEL